MNRCNAFIGVLFAAFTAQAEVIAERSISDDTVINVPVGETMRIEYLSGTGAATITKTGGGTLEIAVVGNTNLAFAVQEGTLRSARIGKLRDLEGLYYHVDASDQSGMSMENVGGTNFVSRWGDVDGREAYATSGARKARPFIVDAALNGLDVMDFGGFSSTEGVAVNGTTAAYLDWNAPKFVRESFWVWRDHDGLKDLASTSGNDFYGPTPVLLGSALYRGKGGNGRDFLFSHVGAPESLKMSATVDGLSIQPVGSRVGEGWHIAGVRMPGTYVGTNNVDATYGGTAFGRRTYPPPSGGFQLAEAVFSTNTLTDADATYVNDYLRCKWFAATVENVTVAKGAKLDVSDVPLRIVRLHLVDDANVDGIGNIRAMEVFAPSNTMLVVDSVFHAVDFAKSATPNLAFAGKGEVAVESGTARGNIIDGVGELSKTGAGTLEISYLTEGITSLSVKEGALTLSPILTADSVLHFDASQFVSTEDSDGKSLVTEWKDVNAGRGSSLLPVSGGYAFDRTKPVNRPYLLDSAANGLPIVDFGSFAHSSNQGGYGAGLALSKPLAGGKKSVDTNDGWLQAFVVWQDDESAMAQPLVDGNEFVGPCLFGSNWSWTRGKGGNGNGFPIAGTTAADFRQSLNIDGERISYVECGTRRISAGLHLLDTRPGCADGLSGVQVAGCKIEAKDTSYYGGIRLGEFIFFRHYIPDGQRKNIAAALWNKWFGTDNANLALEYGYESLCIATGATASFPYADVTVTNLTASGSVSAKSVTVADGGRLIVVGDNDGIACLTANALHFEGKGTVDLSQVELGDRIESAVKIASVPQGPSTPVRVPRWRMSTDSTFAGGLLERRHDGYYLVPPHGMTVVIR